MSKTDHTMTKPPPQEGRFHRSNMQRACLSCKKRKSRCKMDSANMSTCLMCRIHETQCVFTVPSEYIRRGSRPQPTRSSGRKRLDQSKSSTNTPSIITEIPQHSTSSSRLKDDLHRAQSPRETPFSSSTIGLAGGDTESHVISPLLSTDTQLIAKYLSCDPIVGVGLIRHFPGDLMAGKKSTIFNTVRRRPLGTSSTQTTASLKCQIVEKLIDPFCNDLIDL